MSGEQRQQRRRPRRRQELPEPVELPRPPRRRTAAPPTDRLADLLERIDRILQPRRS